MDIRIPSLLRIKPDTLFKLGKYLRKHGFDRIALCYGEGIEELVGRSIRISLDSSEITVVRQEVVHSNDVTDIMGVAFHLPRGTQAVVAVGGGVAVDAGSALPPLIHHAAIPMLRTSRNTMAARRIMS